ncbi:MAG: DUF4350 domain-containing protein [Pedobacter sp.]|nr:DUF4350 domain-containing protein [Pedobacter sp.]
MKRWWPLLVLALLLAAFFACFTLEERERDTGYSSEARMNQWLAAGRLLEKQGQKIRFAPSYGRLPRQADVIVLATPVEYLDAAEQEALLAWVKKGGHLVSELQTVSEEDEEPDASDLLYKTVGVRHYDAAEPETPPAASTSAQTPAPAKYATAKEAHSRFLPTRIANEGDIRSTLDADYFLTYSQPKPEWTVSSGERAHALRFALERGHITVLSDLLWMHNGNLAVADNAALLWRVVNAKAGATVWLIHGEERPSLFSLLLEHASLLLKAIALFVLVWLWQASRRFGPVQPPQENNRRRLGEHLEASGRYLMQLGATDTLLNASRQRLLNQLQRQHPQWRRLPPEKLALHLGDRAQLESAAILRVLSASHPDNLLQFAADIRLLNRLRKAL